MKQSLYFSHDYNARGDENIVRMRMALGWEGYGIYWAIVEQMYEHEGKLSKDYKTIAFYLQTGEDKIRAIVEDFGLFTADNGIITSESVTRRIAERNYKSDLGTLNVEKRWAKARAIQPQYGGNTIKEIKKINEINKYSVEFEAFWAKYPRKTAKVKAWESWNKKSPPIEQCLKTLSWQVLTKQWQEVDEQGVLRWVPLPTTWINQCRWEDEQPASGQKPQPQYREVCPGDPGFPGGVK